MVSLLQSIYSKLNEVHSRVYFELVPEKDPKTQLPPELPYILYKFPNSNRAEYREDFTLEIDIWDNKADTTELETITDNIDKKLNRLQILDENFHVSIYRINRLMVPDTDPSIHRRQLRYNVKTYFR